MQLAGCIDLIGCTDGMNLASQCAVFFGNGKITALDVDIGSEYVNAADL